MNKRRKNISLTLLVHILIWIVFVFIPFFSAPEIFDFLMRNKVYLINYLTISFLSILFFYYNYKFAIAQLYFKRKKILYALSILFFVVIIVFTFHSIFRLSKINPSELFHKSRRMFAALGAKLLIVFIISWILRLIQISKTHEIEKNKAELAYLKTQINPHFLFNTLNSLYALALKKSDKTADSITQLSELMRYVMTDAKADKVSLEKEMEYIQNYIELQKIRLTLSTTVSITINGNLAGKTIEPLLLISFIENAFKYGVSTEKKSTIEISISVEGSQLYLIVKNQKVNSNTVSTEIGVKNTIKRLQLNYKGHHDLKIDDLSESYKVHLKINLK